MSGRGPRGRRARGIPGHLRRRHHRGAGSGLQPRGPQIPHAHRGDRRRRTEPEVCGTTTGSPTATATTTSTSARRPAAISPPTGTPPATTSSSRGTPATPSPTPGSASPTWSPRVSTGGAIEPIGGSAAGLVKLSQRARTNTLSQSWLNGHGRLPGPSGAASLHRRDQPALEVQPDHHLRRSGERFELLPDGRRKPGERRGPQRGADVRRVGDAQGAFRCEEPEQDRWVRAGGADSKPAGWLRRAGPRR